MIRDYARQASGDTDGLLLTWTSSNGRQMFHIISYDDVFNVLVVSEFTERVHPSHQGQRKSVSAERRAVSAERRAAIACAVRKRSEQAAQKKHLEDQQRHLEALARQQAAIVADMGKALAMRSSAPVPVSDRQTWVPGKLSKYSNPRGNSPAKVTKRSRTSNSGGKGSKEKKHKVTSAQLQEITDKMLTLMRAPRMREKVEGITEADLITAIEQT